MPLSPSTPDLAVLSNEPYPCPSAQNERPPETLTERLLAAGQGDRDAFSEVFRAMNGAVTRAAAAIVLDQAQAEEVAQDVLLEVWLKASRFDPRRGSAYTWIMVMARRRAIDRVRQAQQSRMRDYKYHDQGPAQHEDDVADVVARRHTSQEVRSRLGDLTALQREAVRLAFFEGHTTYAAVAKVLSVPAPTAKTRIRDALIRLRVSLADHAAYAESA